MLERSVADAKDARTGASDATVHDLPAPKKAAAKKATARKSAAKKSSEPSVKRTAAKRKPPRSA
ncbi:hypothetical protein [Streptomyces sp. NPDC058613]|uniref:hypothetical protein n=1 Tax=Streptomyces sp. NPDC058613 TaxID=3346556 RepID=UPI003655FB32